MILGIAQVSAPMSETGGYAADSQQVKKAVSPCSHIDNCSPRAYDDYELISIEEKASEEEARIRHRLYSDGECIAHR